MCRGSAASWQGVCSAPRWPALAPAQLPTRFLLSPARENGVTLVAYSPLCQGLLTGQYSRENRPTGPRAQLFTDQR